MGQSRQGGFIRREPGQQRTVRQLFQLVFLWTLVCVGGAGGIGAGIFAAVGQSQVALAIVVAAAAVLLSGLITAVAAAIEGIPGVAAAVGGYLVKLMVIVGCVALALNSLEINGRALVISLIALEIVSLITMSVVVLRGEGPGLDISDMDLEGK